MEIGVRSIDDNESAETKMSAAQHTLLAPAAIDEPSSSAPSAAAVASSSDSSNPNPNQVASASTTIATATMTSTSTATKVSTLKRGGSGIKDGASFGKSSATAQNGLKRIKLEHPNETLTTATTATPASTTAPSESSNEKSSKPSISSISTTEAAAPPAPASASAPGVISPGGATKETIRTAAAPTTTTTMTATAAEASTSAVSTESEEPAPHKATHFRHLRQKYLSELEYMLREFQKLERQLRGAAASAESAGSRERREKLHSFIEHLEETIQQIAAGVELEAAGQPTCPPSLSPVVVNAAKLHSTSMSKEKEQEENVQRLEEHILANLLPVQVRLKKQLAAQQGAKHNPAGMPTVRGGSLAQSTAPQGKATFLKAAPPPVLTTHHEPSSTTPKAARPLPASQTQFGKPLDGGGSSLTQKLHGEMLGSHSRSHGSGVGQPQHATAPGSDAKTANKARAQNIDSDYAKEQSSSNSTTTTKKILYAGMALGSKQIQSSISAANSVHKMVIHNPDLLEMQSEAHAVLNSAQHTPTSTDSGLQQDSRGDKSSNLKPHAKTTAEPIAPTSNSQVPATKSATAAAAPADEADGENDRTQLSQSAKAAILSYEERRKLRKKRRRKRKRRRLQQQAAAAAAATAARQSMSTTIVKRKTKTVVAPRGPRNVEYMCALCNEVYNSTCDCNPWWALAQHECPKCRKLQIPRVDISAPANAIEYHPALLAHADEGAAAAAASVTTVAATAAAAPEAVIVPSAAPPPAPALAGSDDDFDDDHSDLSDDDGLLSEDDDEKDDDDDSSAGGSCGSEHLVSMSPAEQAEYERFGAEYQGPKLSDEQASSLLNLMLHATTCPCRHTNEVNREVCRSTKWMMLHVRDCPGTTASFDVCPFPWCRKVKHLLYHLVSCKEPEQCKICSGSLLARNMRRLHCLNAHRGQKYHEALVAKAKKDAEISKANSRSSGSTDSSKPRAEPQQKAAKPVAAAVAEKPAAATSHEPAIALAAAVAAQEIAPTASHPDLSGIAGSSNSLAALAAAADALAAEDFDADIDDAMVEAVATDPVQIHIPFAEAETVGASEGASQEPVSSNVPPSGSDPSAVKDKRDVTEVSAPPEVDIPVHNSVEVKMELDDVPSSDHQAEPIPSAPPVKMEDETDATNSESIPNESEHEPAPLVPRGGTATTHTACTDEAEENGGRPMSVVDKAATVVDRSKTESPTNGSEKPPAKPLRVL